MKLDRAGRALWCLLALGLLAQAALARVPGMWGWGLDALRFVAPPLGLGVWALAALALVPPVARAVVPALDRLGRAFESHPAPVAFVRAALAGAFVWLLADRVWLVGDFLWRQTALEGPSTFANLYPQAFPLDGAIHDRLARLVMHAGGLDANAAGRLLGALTAAALAVVSIRLTRVLEFQGVAAVTASAVVYWGGHLTLMTGYDKSLAELCVVFVLVAVEAMGLVRAGRGGLLLGAALALALLLHRAAVGLVPGVLAAWGIAFARHRRNAGLRAPGTVVGFALPLIVLVALAPRLVAIAVHVDPVHFAPDAPGGGALAALANPIHLADLVNVVPMLCPLALALPLVVAVRRTARREPEFWVLVACAAPFVAVLPVLRPAQGLFHDWDVFAPGLILVTLVIAWTLATLVRERPQLEWLGVSACAAAIAPMLLWLAHFHDLDRGLARVEAYLAGPPARTTREVLAAWEFLGFRELDMGRAEESAAAFARAASSAPSPRVLREWAVAEERRGRPEEARTIYRRLAERDPESVVAWTELVRLALAAGDLHEARAAAEAVLRIDPTNASARRLLLALPADSTMAKPVPGPR